MSYKSFSKLFLFSILFISSKSLFAASSSDEYEAKLAPSVQSKAKGVVKFVSSDGNNIEIKGSITGLTPGEHGMHVHEVGDCSDVETGFKKSGSHFNPEHANHGSLHDGHAGDLGNIVADKNGEAHFDIKTSKFNLIQDDKHSILGRALVVHAGKDDEKTNPAGNSGERILCGVVKSK